MYEFYITIDGSKQGRFAGESTREAHAGKIEGLAFDLATSAPLAASGKAAGKVVHQPVRFTKQWGPASPQLFQACVTGEVLNSVLFEFMRTTDEGIEEVFHTVHLSQARVVEVHPFVDLDAEPSSLMPLPPLEEIVIAFTAITVENHLGGTSASHGTTARSAKAKQAAKPTVKRAAKAKPRRPATRR